MSIVNSIPDILKFIESKSDYLAMSKNMFDVLEGDIYSKLVEALRVQVLSDNAFKSAVQRIPPINIMKRVTSKLTQIYVNGPSREVYLNGEKYPAGQGVIDYYVNQFDINAKLFDVDFFGNSIRYSACEPYVNSNGEPSLRVIPSHTFLVWSDDLVDPNIPKVFIKMMGSIKKNGVSTNIYWLYSKEEFLIIDQQGEIIQRDENAYGIIPQTYFNDSSYLLMPKHEVDLYKISILVPLMYTDLSDASRYMAYSMIYTIDTESSTSFERNPNVVIDLKSDSVNKTPTIGTLEPKVDIPNVLELIKTIMSDFMETKGLKAASGDVQLGNNASGIALMISEMDTTNKIKERMLKFEKFESEMWDKIIQIHNVWVENGTVVGLPMLPENTIVKTEFELPKPIEEEDARLDRAIKARDAGLATTKEAIRIWMPWKEEKEIDEMVFELENENKIEVITDGQQMDEDNNSVNSQL